MKKEKRNAIVAYNVACSDSVYVMLQERNGARTRAYVNAAGTKGNWRVLKGAVLPQLRKPPSPFSSPTAGLINDLLSGIQTLLLGSSLTLRATAIVTSYSLYIGYNKHRGCL